MLTLFSPKPRATSRGGPPQSSLHTSAVCTRQTETGGALVAAVQLDGRAAIFRQQDGVALLHCHWDDVAVEAAPAGAHSDHAALAHLRPQAQDGEQAKHAEAFAWPCSSLWLPGGPLTR